MSLKNFIQMEQFYHFYQPIYELTLGTKVGYEMLLRSDAYQNPEIPFHLARKENQLYELDTRSIRKAISCFYSESPSEETGTLFLNVFPSTVLNPSFPAFLNQIVANIHLESKHLVLEISESEFIEDMDSMKDRISELQQDGFLIAIDDIGKGYSCIKSIIELEPDYLKLDRYFAHDLYKSPKKQEFISFLIKFCGNTRSQLILEGVESKEELETAKDIGISIAQGYFLGKPGLLKKSICI